jgi:hypothetical protein
MDGFVTFLVVIAVVVFVVAMTGLRIVRPWEKASSNAWVSTSVRSAAG